MGFCGKVAFIAVILTAIGIGLWLTKEVEEVHLPADTWWGPGTPRKVDESIRPFKIDVPETVITDLNTQLDRWLSKKQTPPLENQGFQYGFNTDYLREVVKHWRNNYKWSARQTLLNKYNQYKTNINGLDIHFIRVTPSNSNNKKILPLLLLHGWPGSVKEFYGAIPLLTTPNKYNDFVFELIIPSLPGYGFSDGAAKAGLGAPQIAVLMNNLMKRIGFEKYYVQGGDWGAIISKTMAYLYPENILGAHANMCFINTFMSVVKTFVGSFYPPLVVEKENQHKLYPYSNVFTFMLEESGYMHLQATKPDTIGTALKDSPVGLATYILEKFSTWTNPDWKSLPDGGLTKKFTLDDLLDNIMIYWVTGSITTSQRLYAETFSKTNFALQLDEKPVNVATACARYHNDLAWQPESILKEHYKNMVHLSDFKDGGHFAAFELPKEFSDDVWLAISKMEMFKFRNKK